MFQLGEFKKISSNADVDVELPAPPESRTLTDKKGFVIFGILMLVLVSTSSDLLLLFKIHFAELKMNWNRFLNIKTLSVSLSDLHSGKIRHKKTGPWSRQLWEPLWCHQRKNLRNKLFWTGLLKPAVSFLYRVIINDCLIAVVGDVVECAASFIT
jgi:hypothetical protein